MTHTGPAATDLLPVGSFARITDDEHGHAGRVGEIVHNSDNGWYRLRIDNGVAVLYRRHQIEAAPRAEGLPVKRDILASKIRGLTQLLDGVDATDTEVLDGLRGAIADAEAELAAIDAELAAPAPAKRRREGKREAAQRREIELVRALVAGLDDATLLALHKAAKAQAAVLDVVAGSVPEQRGDADRLRAIAPVLHRAIVARDVIEEMNR